MEESYLEIVNKRKQNEIANIKKCNEYTNKYGLILSDNQISNLLEIRKETLKQTGRIEFREGGVRIDIWTHFMRGCIIDYVH